MTKYRAQKWVSNKGDEEWIMQKRWLGLFWVDILWLVAPDTYDRLRFSTEEAAAKWISKTIELSELRWSKALANPPLGGE